MTTAQDRIEWIKATILDLRAWGCNNLADELASEYEYLLDEEPREVE